MNLRSVKELVPKIDINLMIEKRNIDNFSYQKMFLKSEIDLMLVEAHSTYLANVRYEFS